MQIFASSVGWKVIGTRGDRQERVVRRVPEEAGQDQQDDPGERDQIAVALEGLVVAQEDDRRREEDQAEDEPVGLVAGEALVEAIEHHHPERGEQRDEREEERIGVGQPDPDDDVGGDAEGQEVGRRRTRSGCRAGPSS